MLNVMNNEARIRYLTARSRIAANSPQADLVRKSMDFERAFVAAGGLLMAGLDPTGNGGVVAGFGDLREVVVCVRQLEIRRHHATSIAPDRDGLPGVRRRKRRRGGERSLGGCHVEIA